MSKMTATNNPVPVICPPGKLIVPKYPTVALLTTGSLPWTRFTWTPLTVILMDLVHVTPVVPHGTFSAVTQKPFVSLWRTRMYSQLPW
jgi:hypothetical protein